MSNKRTFLIVCDSVGIGEAPDAAKFDDTGSHTLKHIANAVGGLNLPTMAQMGLGSIDEILGIPAKSQPQSYYGKMEEVSAGKDTMTGHWELMGLHIDAPFRTFTETGFPASLIEDLAAYSKRPILGNKAASGTEILDELGEEHLQTGGLIVYTSADSVLQIAAHEDVVPIDELYRICAYARKITLEEPYTLGRIIARPFLGDRKGAFKRTANRKDYALKPYGKTTLDFLKEAQYDVIALGKIHDIYDGEGITKSIKHPTNEEGMKNLIELAQTDFNGLAFINLVDFDALYGHRRDPKGYHEALETFDRQLAMLMPHLREDDWLIITADHGNDPTHHGTDHTREYVPLLVHSPSFTKGSNLGTIRSFASLAKTISKRYDVRDTGHGTSFYTHLK